MNIDKNKWHYKLWKYSFTNSVPYETDLCRYCHRVFWSLLAVTIFIVCVLGIIGAAFALLFMIGRAFWIDTNLAFKVAGALIVSLALIISYVRWLRGSRKSVEDQGLVKNWVRARKEGVCPLVTFQDDDEEDADDEDAYDEECNEYECNKEDCDKEGCHD